LHQCRQKTNKKNKKAICSFFYLKPTVLKTFFCLRKVVRTFFPLSVTKKQENNI